jgi:hypothetical protein
MCNFHRLAYALSLRQLVRITRYEKNKTRITPHTDLYLALFLWCVCIYGRVMGYVFRLGHILLHSRHAHHDTGISLVADPNNPNHPNRPKARTRLAWRGMRQRGAGKSATGLPGKQNNTNNKNKKKKTFLRNTLIFIIIIIIIIYFSIPYLCHPILSVRRGTVCWQYKQYLFIVISIYLLLLVFIYCY